MGLCAKQDKHSEQTVQAGLQTLHKGPFSFDREYFIFLQNLSVNEIKIPVLLVSFFCLCGLG